MKPAEKKLPLPQTIIEDAFKGAYILLGNITDELQLSYYGRMILKVVKKNEQLSNSQLLMMELLEVPPTFTQEHFYKIALYYERMSKIRRSLEQSRLPAFLEVLHLDNLTTKSSKCETTYVCITRKYIEGMRMLSSEIFPQQKVNLTAKDYLQCSTEQEKNRYYEQIVATLRFIEEVEPQFHYGEISPYSLAVGRDVFVDAEKDTIKIIDTYCDRFLRSIDPNLNPKDPKLVERDAFCSKFVVDKIGNEKLSLEPFDDLWGCCMTMYALETGKSFFEADRQTLTNELTRFSSASSEERVSFIDSRLSKKYGADSLLRSVLSSMSTKDSFSKSFKDLEHSIFRANHIVSNESSSGAPNNEITTTISTVPMISLPLSETDRRVLPIIEALQKKNENVPDWQIEIRASDKQFVEEEVLQQLKQKQDDNLLNEYLQRIAFTTYGRQIKYVERENEGKLRCTGIIIYPDGNNQKHLFNDEKVIRAKAFLKQYEGDVEIIKMEALFWPVGLNPITVNSRLTDQVIYTPETGNPGEDAPETIKMEVILGYSQRDVDQMVKRLNAVDIRKQCREMLENKVRLYSEKYDKQSRVNYFNFKHHNKHVMEFAKTELVPLLSIRFKVALIEMSLSSNKLEDKDVEMMVDQNFPLFLQLQRLNLSYNFLTDGALEKMRLASVRRSRPYFRNLRQLMMSHNRIQYCLCFKQNHGYKRLEILDFSHNQIKVADYDNMFRALQARKMVDLGNNPFVKRILGNRNVKERLEEEQERNRYNILLSEKQTFDLAEGLEQLPPHDKKDQSVANPSVTSTRRQDFTSNRRNDTKR